MIEEATTDDAGDCAGRRGSQRAFQYAVPAGIVKRERSGMMSCRLSAIYLLLSFTAKACGIVSIGDKCGTSIYQSINARPMV